MLLTITNTDIRGFIMMQDRILRPFETDLQHLPKTRLETVRRISERSTGQFRGFLTDVQLPRLSAPLQCPYPTGRLFYSMSDSADSGSLVWSNMEAIGIIFGGGVANGNPNDTMRISDLKVICERIKEKWGKDCVVYEGY
jgi:hypothetical protein